MGKPCLIFLLDEEAPWPRVHIDRGTEAEQIEALRSELVVRHMCSTFNGPGDLAALVTAAVANCLADIGRPTGALQSLSAETLKRYYDRLHQQYGGLDLDALDPAAARRIPADAAHLGVHRAVRTRGPAAGRAAPRVVAADAVRGPPRDRGRARRGRPRRAGPAAQGLPGQAAAPAVRRRRRARQPAPSCCSATPARASRPRPATSPSRFAHRARRSTTGSAALDGHLPLFIELRSYVALYAEGKCSNFVEYLDHRAGLDGLGLERAALLQLPDRRRPGRGHLRRPRRDLRQAPPRGGRQPDRRVRRRVPARAGASSPPGSSATPGGCSASSASPTSRCRTSTTSRSPSSWPAGTDLAMHDRPGDVRGPPGPAAGGDAALAVDPRAGRQPDAADHPGDHRQAPGAAPRAVEAVTTTPRRVLVEHWDINRHLQDQYESPGFIDAEDKKELLRRLAYKVQSGERGPGRQLRQRRGPERGLRGIPGRALPARPGRGARDGPRDDQPVPRAQLHPQPLRPAPLRLRAPHVPRVLLRRGRRRQVQARPAAGRSTGCKDLFDRALGRPVLARGAPAGRRRAARAAHAPS